MERAPPVLAGGWGMLTKGQSVLAEGRNTLVHMHKKVDTLEQEQSTCAQRVGRAHRWPGHLCMQMVGCVCRCGG